MIFDDLLKEIPDGPLFMTGKWLKRLLSALLTDRVRAVSPDLQEIANPAGRFLALGDSPLTFDCWVNGTLQLVTVRARIVRPEATE